jgi:hypothetical protein
MADNLNENQSQRQSLSRIFLFMSQSWKSYFTRDLTALKLLVLKFSTTVVLRRNTSRLAVKVPASTSLATPIVLLHPLCGGREEQTVS